MRFKTLFTTFYSYKGGVGRTSALVNAALLRAIEGDRVVVVDFDFEAPGITSYVNSLARSKGKEVDLDAREGIVEYLFDAVNTDNIPSLKSCAITSKDLGLKLDGEIWFIGAGNTTDKSYTRKFSSLNWSKIFESNQGELLLANFKNQIISEFGNPDHVFIDSRTGISEIGGVCTRYLADSVIILSSLNDQNIHGTSKIYNTFKESKLHTILVASNVPVGLPWGEGQLFFDRVAKFEECFGRRPDLLIYNYPSLSLMEFFSAFLKMEKKDNVLRDDPLLKSYEALSKKINLENNSNYDKLLEEIVARMFIFDSTRNNKVDEYMDFHSKYYNHRKGVFNTLSLLKSIRLKLDIDDSADIVNKGCVKNLNKLKKVKDAYKDERLNMLIDYTLGQASDEIVTYYSKNKDDIKNDADWLDILPDHEKHAAIDMLMGLSKYLIVYNKLSGRHDYSFFYFARGFAAEKLHKQKEAKNSYSKFVKFYDASPTEVVYVAIAFSVSYALSKLDRYNEALIFINRAREIIEANREVLNSMFVPYEFKNADSLEVYKKEINNFEIKLSKLN